MLGVGASVGQRRARTAVVHRLEQRLSQAERDFARHELVVRVGVSELAARIAVVLVVDVLVVEHQHDVLEDEVEDPLAPLVVAAQVAAGREGREGGERRGGGGGAEEEVGMGNGPG